MDLSAFHGEKIILLPILFFIFFIFIRPSNQLNPNFIGGPCRRLRGNYTENNLYHLNLLSALSNLTSLSSVQSFSNFTVGSNADSQNKVYALYSCRNDLTLESCQDCIEDASKTVLQLCNAKEAIILYEECMLRYANHPVVSQMELSDPGYKGCSSIGLPDDGEMKQLVESIFKGLIDEATSVNSSRYYAVGERSYFKYEKIYGLVQCTPDITREQCKECLMDAFNSTILCTNTGRMIGLLNGPSCQLRYDFSSFYKLSSALPPMTSPPARSRTSGGHKFEVKLEIFLFLSPFLCSSVLFW